MKKIVLGLIVAGSIAFSAEAPVKLAVNDCVESLQNEIIGIIYSNSIKKTHSVEALTEKINKTFEKDCDTNATEDKEARKARLLKEEDKNTSDEYVLILDTTKGSEDCIENLQNEIAKIINTPVDTKKKDKAIKLIIKGDGNNCTKEPEKK
ncbi:MAG: hypothetical protein PHN18_04820 [Sulfurospirillaceae bacterium]|nr:hypothetical protein [Sulfurospirillaceae bacterium]MDD2825271.1 hypothetical protein [Sulfurospirillaceae bacterium]